MEDPSVRVILIDILVLVKDIGRDDLIKSKLNKIIIKDVRSDKVRHPLGVACIKILFDSWHCFNINVWDIDSGLGNKKKSSLQIHLSVYVSNNSNMSEPHEESHRDGKTSALSDISQHLSK